MVLALNLYSQPVHTCVSEYIGSLFVNLLSELGLDASQVLQLLLLLQNIKVGLSFLLLNKFFLFELLKKVVPELAFVLNYLLFVLDPTLDWRKPLRLN